MERGAPGLAALFHELAKGGEHTLLDLGGPSPANLEIYGRFGPRIRFADLLASPPQDPVWSSDLPPHPQDPYDVVVAWDILDRIAPGHRTQLIQQLDRITAPGTQLYLVVRATDVPFARPQRYSLVDTHHVSQEADGAEEPTHPQLLPAQVERLLRPFTVLRAFTIRTGYREYLARK